MGLLSTLYGLVLKGRKIGYHHLIKPGRLPAKVLCVGNLTLGGTGKTPAVIAVAREARKRGHNPCILTRGYRGKARGISLVSRGDLPLLSPREAGDEAFLMASTLKGVTIVKGKDRFRAGIEACENSELAIVNHQVPTLFILDDGFQHWKLFRDLDVVLIDATNPFGNEKLFPEGILREPLDSLDRAHVIVITKADRAAQGEIQELTRKIRLFNREAPIYTAIHLPAGLVDIRGDMEGLDSLLNRDVYAFAGIANHSHFRSSLEKCGARITGFRKFRDHHDYTQANIDEIKTESQGLDIVTTEKDLVKLKDFDTTLNITALKIEFSVDAGFYDTVFRLIDR